MAFPGDYLKKTKEIQGWLSFHDVTAIHMLLSLQNELMIKGDILEIGVYQGKSAILLGHFIDDDTKLYVCDVFEDVPEGLNGSEISRSYQIVSLNQFKSNFLLYHKVLPEICNGSSLELPQLLGSNTFRFIHIDGSHLYEIFSKDLAFSTEHLIHRGGVIAIDDFRASHTFGVALETWNLIHDGVYLPIISTSAKIYLCHNSFEFNLDEIEIRLSEVGIPFVRESLFGRQYVRTLGADDENQYVRFKRIKKLFPPIVIPYLQKLARYI